MGKHLVTIGDLVLDIIMPVTFPVVGGVHQQVTDRRIEPGGAANTIITALRLGLDVSLAGAVGSDIYGEQILAPLRAAGANLDQVVVVPGASTLVVTLTDRASGEHVFIGHYGESEEMPYPDGLDDLIQRADAVFLSGYTLVEQRIVAMALRALDQAVATNTPITMDVGPLLEMADQAHIRYVLQHTHVLFLTDDEARLITQDRTGRDAYAGLLALGPEMVVIKRGPQGCLIVSADHWLEVPAFAVDQVVDTVGAGDAFDAAFIAGMLHGLSLRECALLANATGAASTRKVGSGTNAPTCDDIMAVLHAAGETINFSC
jgi:sugar/nucleoside kinase (ribokinase family)